MENTNQQMAKLDNGNVEDKESKSSSNCEDEEGNGDMSLKVVDKDMSMQSTESIKDGAISGDSSNHCVDNRVVDRTRTECDPFIVLEMENVNSEISVDEKEIDQNVEIVEPTVIIANEKELVEGIAAKVTVEPLDPNAVETTDNIVLRKLLRGPRYFDPPEIRWDSCYNCGEEGHTMVNCTPLKRKKPCFVCGSFEHNAKQCKKGRDCYICKKGGHHAKNCPEKDRGHSPTSKMCLQCGDSEHDIFSCKNDYYRDDLKEIQCYVCKSFGHICCVSSVDTGPSEVSCYKCGHSGHNGLACSQLDREGTGASSRTSCYKCGTEGHFARECTSSSRVGNRNHVKRFSKKGKDYMGFKSAPYGDRKAHKRERGNHEEAAVTTPRRSKHKGGWMTEDPVDFSSEKSKRKRWRSSHTVSTLTDGSYIPSPQSYKKSRKWVASSRFW